MAIPVILPKLGQTMEEGVIERWRVKEGDEVKKGDIILEVTTDKATIEVESYDVGTVLKILRKEGETVPVKEIIAYLGKPGEAVPAAAPSARGAAGVAPKQAAQAAAAPKSAALPVAEDGKVKASPLAKRLADEMGVDLSAVVGTGPGGRITKEDVLAAAESQKGAPKAVPAQAGKAEPLSPMRRVIAERLGAAKRDVPHFYLTMEADMSGAKRFRESKGKLSYTHLLVAAAAKALIDVPGANVSFTPQGLIRHKSANVGVAVALEDGLIVPVVRGADKKSLEAIAADVDGLVKKARAGKLAPEEYQGGTFTISNLGTFGIDFFYAIVNPPEAAILAVGAIKDRPVAVGGKVEVRPMMTLALSADHRAIDGAVGAKFLARVVEILTSPDKNL